MRILQITSVAPGHLSGGAMGVRQTLLSLKGLGAEVDYMGPEIDDEELRSLYTKDYALAPVKNKLLRAVDTLFMKSNLRYRSFLGADADVRLPDRIVDGYGINIRLVEEAKSDSVDTIRSSS